MTRKQVKELDDQIKSLKKEKEDLIAKMQAECDHPQDEWFDISYEPSGVYTLGKPDSRVCKKCGYAEEGWGCGYFKLDAYGDYPAISYRKAHKDYILKFYTQKQLNEVRYAKKN